MIVNRQRRVRVPVQALDEFLAKACKALHVPSEAVTVCLVTNAEMARWNLRYRDKDRPTDVLSFPVKSTTSGATKGRAKRPSETGQVRRQMQDVSVIELQDPGNYLGDIAIAPEVARSNAKKFGRSLGDELRILILHGILHLMGYDHETDTGQMERREQRFRRAFGLEHSGLVNDKGFD